MRLRWLRRQRSAVTVAVAVAVFLLPLTAIVDSKMYFRTLSAASAESPVGSAEERIDSAQVLSALLVVRVAVRGLHQRSRTGLRILCTSPSRSSPRACDVHLHRNAYVPNSVALVGERMRNGSNCFIALLSVRSWAKVTFRRCSVAFSSCCVCEQRFRLDEHHRAQQGRGTPSLLLEQIALVVDLPLEVAVLLSARRVRTPSA